MKTFILSMMIMAGALIGTAQNANCQTQEKGLYLTYKDYLTHKLSYPEGSGSENKISVNDFMEQKNVTVVAGRKKMILEKASLFGYHGSDGTDYRFHDNKSYQIIDTAGFYLYSYQSLVQQGKGPKPVTGYYFSKKSNSALLPLSYRNIQTVFYENAKFRNLVETAAVYHEKPDAFDSDINKYKIKELYFKSVR